MLINHETLMNGRYPDCIQTQLIFGLMSAMLSNSLETSEKADEAIDVLSLPLKAGQGAKDSLQLHIRLLRAMEYAWAGATFELVDDVARAVTKKNQSPYGSFEDLMAAHPMHKWGEFIGTATLTNEMTHAIVCAYLEREESFNVYIEVIQNDQCWLKQIFTDADVIQEATFVVYPKGFVPPAACMNPQHFSKD